MTDAKVTTEVAETARGSVEHIDRGEGHPVLFVHGSPGGADQGSLMGSFLESEGFRVIALSRPGYLGTPLTEDRGSPDQQADLAVALMSHLGIERFSVMCWSGGGPSSYRLAARNPERVQALVGVAAVSGAYSFPGGLAGMEESILTSRFGRWLMKEMIRHTPRSVVKVVPTEEGDLTKEQAKELTDQIWTEPVKRDFVLGLSATVTGRRAGLENDRAQFPAIVDLGLETIVAPTLLVHGTVDTDVPPEHSERALAAIPGAEIHRIEAGTHIATWTDPTADEVQARIVEHLRR